MRTHDPVERALQLDAIRLRARRNGGLLIGLGGLAIIGSWWLLPRSMVEALTAVDPTVGLVSLAVGIIVLASGITLTVLGIQGRKRAGTDDPLSNHEQAHTRFDNPGAPTPNGQPPLNLTGLTTR
jgi:hypothetical protein